MKHLKLQSYIIKNNLPETCSIKQYEGLTRDDAMKHFMFIIDLLSGRFTIKVFFRNEKYKFLRGTIKVEIDGFYYYVELYKE